MTRWFPLPASLAAVTVLVTALSLPAHARAQAVTFGNADLAAQGKTTKNKKKKSLITFKWGDHP